MSQGGYSPWWFRFLVKYAPFMFSECKQGNYHYFYENVCLCSNGCYPRFPIHRKIKGDWVRVGILDMSTREDTK
jgi:hypothetical protein